MYGCSYFPVESTSEMLKEWSHFFCPFDTSMMDAFDLLDLFLPTSGPVNRHDRMYRSVTEFNLLGFRRGSTTNLFERKLFSLHFT